MEPKLLCDEMLMRLGRWLRAADYDTAIAAQKMGGRGVDVKQFQKLLRAYFSR